MNSRVIFSLSDCITRHLACFCMSVCVCAHTMCDCVGAITKISFSSSSKKKSPVDFQTVGVESQTKEGACESFAL